jgi:hypothetical protein
MSVYRNRYFLLGVLLILLGVQFRMVESFVLNDRATRTLARVTKTTPVADNSSMGAIMSYVYPNQTAKIEPPRWLGLACIALGAVVSLHALSIPRSS